MPDVGAGVPLVAAPRVRATPLARFERDGLSAALRKAGLPTDDIDDPEILFWRFEIQNFETQDDVPVGFGGLEIYGDAALLRSLVILPPLRRKGFGAAIVAAIEFEARLLGCGAIYLLTMDERFFVRLGYRNCKRKDVPKAITMGKQFTSLCPANATVMLKELHTSHRPTKWYQRLFSG